MKCPKCGYNSFETYDACKKCGNDLVAFKDSHGIRPLVFPKGVEAAPAVAAAVTQAASQEEESFAWDAPAASSPQQPQAEESGFDFDFSAGAGNTPSAGDEFSFDDVGAPAGAAPTGGHGPAEFDMGDFFAGEAEPKKEESKGGGGELDLAFDEFNFDEETPAKK